MYNNFIEVILLKTFFTPLKLLVTALILLIISFGYYIYSKIPNEPDTSKIETLTAKPQYSLSFIGEQQSQESFTLYFNPSLGNVASLFVKNGETIHSDAPLIDYYNPILEKMIVSKKKVLASLLNQSPKPSGGQHIALNTQILELQNRLQTRIHSPIHGKVTVLDPHPSKLNTKIMQINSEKHIIRANITESQLDQIKINQEVNVTTKHAKLFTGKILSISQIPHKVKKEESIYQVDISTQDHYPLGRHFDIDVGSSKIELPTNSIFENDYVLITQNNKIIKRRIEYTKSPKNGYIMVSKGLNFGDKVIVHPSSSLLSY
ncbi:efflux RND transporter periplasmic adaptor subunit [Staphylococcus borealis]|uniref:efflux RND transporter periplasmic adaptor subunit n=1 Tax=Staphylococcus borealis TaxID=2742203 RepID=UPI0025A26349|nr:efflux RND transporter periplasmic adaptor subunit [Staphylococcus borealis]MDM7864231.1 efflux RND transporter periplasmic adaptor subunit [Staphylococcus borealis]